MTISSANFESADWSGIDSDDTDFGFAPSLNENTSEARSDIATIANLRESPVFIIDFPEHGRVEKDGVISNGPDSVVFLYKDDIVTTSYNDDGSATLSIRNRPNCIVDTEQFDRGSQILAKPRIVPTQVLPLHSDSDTDGDTQLRIVG